MGKELSEMTLEELWKLFPIFLIEYNIKWTDYYKEVEFLLQDILSDCAIDRISHIESTAMQGIWAKNIVDVMVEMPADTDMEYAARKMEKNGFIRMSTGEKRISLNKGYTKKGFEDKVYHVHLRYTGDNDEFYFRDYLREFPKVAIEYELLKLEL